MRPSNQLADPSTPLNWTILKQLWPYLTEFKVRVISAMVFMILAKVASVKLPLMLGAIVKDLEPLNSTEITLIVPVGLILAYGIFRFLMVLFGEIRDTLFGRVTERAMRRVGLKVFKHLHSLDLEFHLNRRTGGLSRDIERGTSGINFLMRFMIFNIVPTLLEIAMVLGILLYNYGSSFALVTLTAIVAYIIFSFITTEWRLKYIRAQNKADSDSSTQAIDSLINHETVKYYTNEDFEANRYDKEIETWENAKRTNRLTLFVVNSGQALIIAIAITAMMYLASKQVAEKTLDISDLVIINAFMMQLFIPLNFLGFVYREMKNSLVNIEKMFELLNVKATISDSKNSIKLDASNSSITFNNLSFHYKQNRPILKNISFSINPGEKVAIVGPSGSGKSTLVKLLFRFYDPTAGSILINQQDISQVTQHSLRKAIGIVPQDTVLFNQSIFENIRYGDPTATDEDVEAAIKLAHLKSFIESLPEGSKTVVGERGLKLSGGEKQRVAIARTLLKKPDILVFDEATSSLDSKSEKAILEAIDEISEGYTTISIAHRLSTIKNSDQILVIDNGELVETGTHQQLLEANSVYADLWRVQHNKQSNQ
jgi:ATP-binding cassette subfamily B protein